MKQYLIIFLLMPCFVWGQKIEIKNTLPIARKQAVVDIPWKQVQDKNPGIDTTGFKVIESKSKKEIPFQLEYKGREAVQNLLVQVDVAAKSSVGLVLVKGSPKKFQTKTYARFVPERKDDFAWENDRIAFRVYGKALENYPKEMAYGVDVWVKRVPEMVLDKRYKLNKYHVDNGDGLDYYHVGRTLGAGGIAPYMNDTIWYSKNFTEWKILDNGPLRSTFQLMYDEWLTGNVKVKAVKTISLDAGLQLSKTEVKFDWDTSNNLPVVAGIIKRKEPGAILLNEADGIMGYWEPQHGNDGTTGVGCVFSSAVTKMMVNDEQILGLINVNKSKGSIIYYNGAAWDKAKMITGSGQWFDYLKQFKNMIEHPLLVTVK